MSKEKASSRKGPRASRGSKASATPGNSSLPARSSGALVAAKAKSVPTTLPAQETASSPPLLDLRFVDGRFVGTGMKCPEVADGWRPLMSSLGTDSFTFMQSLLGNIEAVACPTGRLDEQRINNVLSSVQGIQPRDETEAMLAIQMVAIHTATIRASRRLSLAAEDEERELACNMLGKLARTYAMQVEALKKYRSTSEQIIRVHHQHVTVENGGQAIIGSVETQGVGDRKKSEDQPHAKQIGDASQPALRCPNSGRLPVSVAGNDERSLQNARRVIAGRAERKQKQVQARPVRR
jgi:hypothetical protein